MTDDQQRLCSFVSAHPELLDALYDLDLTPEQTLGTRDWSRTVRVVALYEQAAGIEPPWSASEKESPAAQARRRSRDTGEAPPACAWTDEDPPCSCLVDEAFARATQPASAAKLMPQDIAWIIRRPPRADDAAPRLK